MRRQSRYNNKAYRHFHYRLHAGSNLHDRVSAYQEDGGSLNFLITDLLAQHFNVDNPYKYQYVKKRVPWVITGFDN